MTRTEHQRRAPRATARARARALVGTVTDVTRAGLDNQAHGMLPLRGKIETETERPAP